MSYAYNNATIFCHLILKYIYLIDCFRFDSPANRELTRRLVQETIQDNGGDICEFLVSTIKCELNILTAFVATVYSRSYLANLC
jgi:hypothetical protein